jgi:hypothetical protein
MIDHRNKVVFVHIPKTGGESITRMIWDTIIPLRDGKHDTISEYKLKYDVENYYKFSFVRNPYKRAQSFYRFLMQHYSPHRINCSFRDWVFDMHGEPKKLFLPQVQFIDDSVDIFKFENFSESLAILNTKIPFIKPNVYTNKSKTNVECDLTSEIKWKIYELYREDFRRFQYDK